MASLLRFPRPFEGMASRVFFFLASGTAGALLSAGQLRLPNATVTKPIGYRVLDGP